MAQKDQHSTLACISYFVRCNKLAFIYLLHILFNGIVLEHQVCELRATDTVRTSHIVKDQQLHLVGQ